MKLETQQDRDLNSAIDPQTLQYGIPAIQPEETVQSWWIRVHLRTGNGSIKETNRTLLGKASSQQSRVTEKLRFCAETHRRTIKQIIQFHTTLPFTFWLSPNAENIERLSKSSLSLHPWNTPWRVCADCAKEDVGYWGFSYYRRQHQLPGVLQCVKHGSMLGECLGKEVGDRLPVVVLSDTNTSTNTQGNCSEQSDQSREYRLYLELSELTLSNSRRPVMSALLSAMRISGEKIGLEKLAQNINDTLHRVPVLRDCLGRDSQFEFDQRKLARLLAMRMTPYSAQTYLIIAAHAFESPEQMWTETTRCEQSGSNSHHLSQRRIAKKDIDWGTLYVNASGNFTEVARQTKTNRGYTAAWLQDKGMVSLKKPHLMRSVSAIQILMNGANLQEACEFAGATQEDVLNSLLIMAGPNLKTVLMALGQALQPNRKIYLDKAVTNSVNGVIRQVRGIIQKRLNSSDVAWLKTVEKKLIGQTSKDLDLDALEKIGLEQPQSRVSAF